MESPLFLEIRAEEAKTSSRTVSRICCRLPRTSLVWSSSQGSRLILRLTMDSFCRKPGFKEYLCPPARRGPTASDCPASASK